MTRNPLPQGAAAPRPAPPRRNPADAHIHPTAAPGWPPPQGAEAEGWAQPPPHPGANRQQPPAWPPPQQAHAPQQNRAPQAARPPNAYDPGYHYPEPAQGQDAYAPAPAPMERRAPARPPQRPQPAAQTAPPRPPAHAQPPVHPQQHAQHQRAAPHYGDPGTAPPRQRAQVQPTLGPAGGLAPPAGSAPMEPGLRGGSYDQWPAQGGQPVPRQAPQPEHPGSYDLGAYMPHAAPNTARGGAHAQHAGARLPQGYPPQGPAHDQAWTNPDDLRYPQEPGFGPAGQPFENAGYDQGGREMVADQEFEHDYEDDDEFEDPPRRSRGLLIVGALVVAIGLGGGLAYGYKTFVAPGGNQKTPLVRANPAPARTLPADPGGKAFANRDVKVMGQRLTEGGAALGSVGQGAQRPAAGADEGVRRVQIVPVRPDGSLAPPPPAPAVSAPIGGPIAGVSGPIRIGVSPGSALPPPAAPSAPEVKTISLPPPGASQPEAAAPPPARPAAAPRVVRAPAADPPAQAATRSVAPAAPAVDRKYVVVLASQRSSMDALKTFADLQQKYDVLQGMAPTVQRADLGDRGVYHRLIVGDPGSRSQASNLCAKIKAAGYSTCWVVAQ